MLPSICQEILKRALQNFFVLVVFISVLWRGEWMLSWQFAVYKGLTIMNTFVNRLLWVPTVCDECCYHLDQQYTASCDEGVSGNNFVPLTLWRRVIVVHCHWGHCAFSHYLLEIPSPQYYMHSDVLLQV